VDAITTEAVAMAIADHLAYAGPCTDWEYVDALHAAKRQLAAAPAMLAALEACVGSEGTGAQEWALKLARAAIAQATGKGI